MRFSERHPLFHQVVGDIGRQGKTAQGCGLHPVGPKHELAEHGFEHAEHAFDGIDRIKQRFLVLLEVPIIGQRQALERGQQGEQVAVDPARLAPDDLGHVGVFLLRHHRTAGGKGVRQLDELKLAAGPQHQLLGKPTQVHADHGADRQKLDQKIPVGHGIEAVCADPGKTEQTGHIGPVYRQAGAGQGAGSERQHIDPVSAFLQALGVAVQHVVIGQQVMGQQHRLGALQVGIARHDHVAVPLGQPGQAFLERGQQLVDVLSFLAQVQADIQHDLVIAAPGGVQLAAQQTDLLGQTPLDRHVDIFVRGQKREAVPLNLTLNPLQTLADFFSFGRGQQLLLDQHLTVGLAALDVVTGQPPVKGQGRGEGLHPGVGRRLKTSGPGFCPGGRLCSAFHTDRSIIAGPAPAAAAAGR